MPQPDRHDSRDLPAKGRRACSRRYRRATAPRTQRVLVTALARTRPCDRAPRGRVGD